MLEFDEEKVRALIKKETGYIGDEIVNAMMKQLKTFRSELQPYFNAWINGEKTNFEFHGISIEEVMQKMGVPYIRAFAGMSLLLENPSRWIKWYKTGDSRTL